MYEMRAWYDKNQTHEMGLWDSESTWKLDNFIRKETLFGNVTKIKILVYVITSILVQKSWGKILLTWWYLALNIGYLKSPLVFVQLNATHFGQLILKIQIFFSNFCFLDFTGNRRLLALFWSLFWVFWGLRSRPFFCRKKNKQKNALFEIIIDLRHK